MPRRTPTGLPKSLLRSSNCASDLDLLLGRVSHGDLRSTASAACCPLCGGVSSSVHSHYQRAPTDLPWAGHPVRLILCVRRFFCKVPSCARRIFTERLPAVVAPWARTTARLTMLLDRKSVV